MGMSLPPPQAFVESWEGHDLDFIFLQDSAGPRQIVCDLPMTQRGPAEEAGQGLWAGHVTMSCQRM
jgi:hypothetical protein